MIALAIPIDYASVPTPASAFVEFMAALANAERNVKGAVKDAHEKMDVAEKRLQASVETMKRTCDLAEQAAIARLPLEADSILEKAERAELHIRTEHEQVSKAIDRIYRLLRRHVPRLVRPLEPVMERYRRVSEWYISEFQEVRWRIMALRAEQHRDERGPVFTNPKDLARHLASITR